MGKSNAAIGEIALPRRAVGREGDPLDLPQARAHLGDVGPQARQGRDPVPRRERLASSRERQRAGHAVSPPDAPTIVSTTAERLDAIAQTEAFRIQVAVRDDLERDRSLLVPDGDRHRRAGRGVLEHVAGSRSRPRPRSRAGTSVPARRRSASGTSASRRRRAQRRDQPPASSSGGIDPVRELPCLPPSPPARRAPSPPAVPSRPRDRRPPKRPRAPGWRRARPGVAARRRAARARWRGVRRRWPARVACEMRAARDLDAQRVELSNHVVLPIRRRDRPPLGRGSCPSLAARRQAEEAPY